jgi:hypothetical protein
MRLGLARIAPLIVTLCLSVLLTAGCPQSPGGNSGPRAITGTYSGTLSCEVIQSLSGSPSPPTTRTRDTSLTFDNNGRPTGIPVFGFSGQPDLTTGIQDVGESETLTSSNGTFDITHTLTVRSATYASSSVRVIIDIDYSATGGNATNTGTGVLTFDASVSEDVLTTSITLEYEVTQATGTLVFDTGESHDCTAELDRQ